MPEVLYNPKQRRDNAESLLLRRVADVTQARVAEALGKDKSQVSRFFSGHQGIEIHELPALFDVLGLELVEVGGESVTLPTDEVSALRLLARKALA